MARPENRLTAQNIYLLLLSIVVILGLGACRRGAPMTTIVVTQVVTAESEGAVVTRIVRQTIDVTATPPAPGESVSDPVTLDISMEGTTPILDPQLAVGSNSLDVVENLFVGLTRHDAATNQLVPELAESWSVAPDGRTWTFQLRDDLLWLRPEADEWPGSVAVVRSVVAADVVYAIRRACDPQTRAPDAFLLFIIEGCERVNRMATAGEADLESIGVRALDDTTLEIALTKPANHFLALTSLSLMRPIPQELVTEFEEEWTMPANLVTSGPFVLKPGSAMDSHIVLWRNPHWPIPFTGNVDIVNIFQFRERSEAFSVWEESHLDIIRPPASQLETLQSRNPQKLLVKPSQAVFYLGFNFDSGILRIPEVRRALSAAIDRERLVAELFGGAAVPMRHFVPPGVIDGPAAGEVGIGYSPSYAQQQMAASGFGDCRLMPPVTFMISSSDLSLRQAELLVDMWVEELECNKDQFIIEQAQFGTLLANTRPEAGERRPDMWDLGWQSQYPDAHNWHSNVLHCQDSENRPRRPCGQVDELIRRANDTAEPAQRAGLYRQVETIFFGEDGLQPIIPLYARGEYLLRQVWVTFTPTSFGGEQYDTYVVDADLKKFERERQG